MVKDKGFGLWIVVHHYKDGDREQHIPFGVWNDPLDAKAWGASGLQMMEGDTWTLERLRMVSKGE